MPTNGLKLVEWQGLCTGFSSSEAAIIEALCLQKMAGADSDDNETPGRTNFIFIFA